MTPHRENLRLARHDFQPVTGRDSPQQFIKRPHRHWLSLCILSDAGRRGTLTLRKFKRLAPGPPASHWQSWARTSPPTEWWPLTSRPVQGSPTQEATASWAQGLSVLGQSSRPRLAASQLLAHLCQRTRGGRQAARLQRHTRRQTQIQPTQKAFLQNPIFCLARYQITSSWLCWVVPRVCLQSSDVRL